VGVVLREVVVAPVGEARELDPVAVDLGLGVPAVRGVVGALAGLVLAEPEPL